MLTKNHGSPLAPSTEATPTDPMKKHEAKQYMIGRHAVFNNPFAGGAKAASAQRTLVLSRQSAIVFGCHHCPSKNKSHFFVKNKACFCKNRHYFLTGRWAAAWAKFYATLFSVPHNVPEWLKDRKPCDKDNRKAIADQVNCKHINF